MPKAPAQDKRTCGTGIALAGLWRLGRVLLPVVLASLVLSLFAERADARPVPWYAKRNYSLELSVDLDYRSIWGDVGVNRADFVQSYRVMHKGYVVDPRLVTYNIHGGFREGTAVQGPGIAGDFTVTNIGAGVTLFEGINRNRGLSMWKYVPSPIALRYDFTTINTGRQTHSYGISMYYSRPGTLRVFSNRKLIFYDDGSNKNLNVRRNLNGNRYRYKYNNSNYNVNGNGATNSNWNRNRNGNGDGNWNADGYKNRNRNTNTNTNRNLNRNLNANSNVNVNVNSREGEGDGTGRESNGNSNWNKNANSNWNGNSNWNRNTNTNTNWNRNWNRNWNKNFNYNQNYNRRVPGLGLFSFAYPQLSFDANQSKSSGGGIAKYDATFASLRASINNKPRKKGNKITYTSIYRMNYLYQDTTSSGTKHRLTLQDDHRWERISWNNQWNYERNEAFTSYMANTNLMYWNSFNIKAQPIGYRVGLDASYSKTGSASGWDATGFFWSSTGKSKKLMPGLTSSSRIQVDYRRKQNKLGNNRNLYSILLEERIKSTQLKNTTIDGSGTIGYTETGMPVSLSVSATIVPSRKVSINTGYSFQYTFLTEHRGATMTHNAWAGVNYAIKPNLKFTGSVSTSTNHTTNGFSSSNTHTEVAGRLAWRINSRSDMDFNARYEFGDSNFTSRYIFSAQYRRQVNRTGTLYVYSHYAGSGSASGGEKMFSVAYSMLYRKVSLSASYKLIIDPESRKVHELNLKATRSFGRTFSKLW